MSLKSLFVKETEEKPVAKKTTTPSLTPTPKSNPSGVNNILNPTQNFATPSANEINEFTEFLNEVYKKGNFPGPDYQEFTDALKTLAGQQIPENLKFVSVFAGLQVQGCTKQRLLETAHKYIELINSQVDGFTGEINKVLTTEIGEKQKKADNLHKENLEIDEQMALLAKKKAKNAEAIIAYTNDINQQTASLNLKKTAFENAANTFIANIQSNAEKINMYLN